MKHNSFIRRSFVLALCLSLVNLAVVSAFAQAKRGAGTAKKASASAPKCSGAWTGSVRYTRTQSLANNNTVDRVSGRGQDTTNFEMKYDYAAQVSVVEAPERNGNSAGIAKVAHSFTSVETTKAVEKNSCDRGKTWRNMTGTFTSQTSTSGNGTVEANVSIGMNSDGTYSVSVGIPEITGETTGKESSTFSGQCTAKEGKTLTMPPTQTRIEGNSLSSDGTHRVDPSSPDRISGSFSHTFQNVTETITWNLRRCGGFLQITDLQFADMKYPNWNEWQDISEQKGTIDGNLVKITAKVLNASPETRFADLKLKETFKGDKWDGARPDGTLDGGEISVRLDPGEEKEVELVWDSSGYAWFDDGRPRLLQRIKVELEENGKKLDEMTKNLKVAPKPLVLVHGLWSNWRAWESWQNILTTTHSYDWKAFPVGEKPEKGIMNTGGAFMSTSRTNGIFENSQELGRYIRYAQEDRNAWHVDIVAHSMGGLISRHYIHHFMPPVEDGRPQVSRLVMLGTPNMGSPCADVMNTAFEVLGKDVEAVRQLRQDVAAEFNRVVTNRKGVRFSVLAGEPLPVMCKTVVWNDGVVPVPSAVWQIADNARSKNVHTELTGTADFSSFVKPRLAIGPKGDHMPEAPSVPSTVTATAASQENTLADQLFGIVDTTRFLDSADHAVVWSQPFAKAVIVPAKGTVEVELPVEAARNLGITFMARPEITVKLVDDKGAIVSKNDSASPGGGGWFRSIFLERDTQRGKWKVVVENSSDIEQEVILTSWFNAN